MLKGDAIIANSKYTRDSVLARAPQVAPRLATIARGADLSAIRPGQSGHRPDRIVSAYGNQWGLAEPAANPKGALKILLPARLSSWKGHMVLIKALELLRLGHQRRRFGASVSPNFQVVFAGGAQSNARYLQALKAATVGAGVSDLIHFVGDCTDMPAAYGWADIVVVPSTRPEAFGRTIVEAGAMERPVIASDHGGAREIIIEGETGLSVPPNDAAALAEALKSLSAADKARRELMGAQARARVEAVYSTEKMCAATLAVYERVLQNSVKKVPNGA